jgi:hypothetical protein
MHPMFEELFIRPRRMPRVNSWLTNRAIAA